MCIRDRIYHGRTGAAAEGGHVTIDYKGPVCGCGKRGCIEALASGPRIAARAREKLAAGAESRILMHAGSIAQVQTEHVGAAFREGDAVAREVLAETAFLLTVWLGNIVDLLEPDVMAVSYTHLLPVGEGIRPHVPAGDDQLRQTRAPFEEAFQ